MEPNTLSNSNMLKKAQQEMGRGWPKEVRKRTGLSITYIRESVRFQRLDAEPKLWEAIAQIKKEYQAKLKLNAKNLQRALPQPA